jgi:hypothetical protein
MSTPVQYPAAQVQVGGQPTVTGWTVTSAKAGWSKDEENKQNADGGHRVRILYSKRRTWDLTLEAQSGTDPSTIKDAEELTVDGVLYNIVTAEPTFTRGPVVMQVSLIAQAEGLT